MKTNTNTKTTTMTNTFKEHLKRKIFEIFGLETFDHTILRITRFTRKEIKIMSLQPIQGSNKTIF